MNGPETEVRVSILLTQPCGTPGRRIGEPVTVGVPMPKGVARTAAGWALSAPDNRFVAFQARALDRWSDGSIRWALVDFQADTPLSGTYALITTEDGRHRAISPGPRIASTAGPSGEVVVDTGAARFVLLAGSSQLFGSVDCGGRPAIDAPRSGLRIRAADGTDCPVAWRSVSLEESGEVRAVVCAEGEASGAGFRLVLSARLHFHAGSPVVRLLLTIRNPRRAAHPGGFWELGDAGSVLLKEASLVLALPEDRGERHIRHSLESGVSASAAVRQVHIYQESSGGENWRSSNHVNRFGQVPFALRGYRASVDDRTLEGLRAQPVVAIVRTGSLLAVTFPHFWQNFPRAIDATVHRLLVSFWPDEHPDLHELQGGEQKTHECYVAFGPDPVTESPLDWVRARTVTHPAPEWYAESGAVPYLTPAATDVNLSYLDLVNAAIEGADTFAHKRERVDEYGWRHYGDIYGDHEAVFPHSPVSWPLVSHYNNQYDPVAGFSYQFMRTGDCRWWQQAQELARHVIDIDIYHTIEDKAAYNNGLFWHTVHYVDAGKATHRSYPRSKASNGGGPASEQNYPTGLMLQYFMTGDPQCREAAVGLSRFVLDMDDGSKSLFRYLSGGDTGLASASRTPFYHGPGRGSGNSLNALVDGHRLTGDGVFLAKAEQIIRRCVHPHEDINRLNLLDAENRWFYTMFLQALGKYLDHKLELGQLDAMYAYGRETLLHYGRWMADHEYPFLEKPEILEYPTETWPAQDMRKCEVLQFAAKHAAGEERDRLMERARFFFEHATRTLSSMPTRTLARPIVLLLSNGFSRAWFQANPDVAVPGPVAAPSAFPTQKVFVPQKARAIARTKLLAAAFAVLGLLACGGLAWWLLG